MKCSWCIKEAVHCHAEPDKEIKSACKKQDDLLIYFFKEEIIEARKKWPEKWRKLNLLPWGKTQINKKNKKG